MKLVGQTVKKSQQLGEYHQRWADSGGRETKWSLKLQRVLGNATDSVQSLSVNPTTELHVFLPLSFFLAIFLHLPQLVW